MRYTYTNLPAWHDADLGRLPGACGTLLYG
jgi:hypothetical protein